MFVSAGKHAKEEKKITTFSLPREYNYNHVDV